VIEHKSQPQPSVACFGCQKRINAFNQINVDFKGKKFTICGRVCLSILKYSLNIQSIVCECCFKYEWPAKSLNLLRHSGSTQVFCSLKCLNMYVLKFRKIVTCTYCNVKKYNFDMIEKYTSAANESQLFCSINCLCLFDFKALGQAQSTQAVEKNCFLCQAVSNGDHQYTTSDGEVQSFCSINCAINYRKYEKARYSISDACNTLLAMYYKEAHDNKLVQSSLSLPNFAQPLSALLKQFYQTDASAKATTLQMPTCPTKNQDTFFSSLFRLVTEPKGTTNTSNSLLKPQTHPSTDLVNTFNKPFLEASSSLTTNSKGSSSLLAKTCTSTNTTASSTSTLDLSSKLKTLNDNYCIQAPLVTLISQSDISSNSNSLSFSKATNPQTSNFIKISKSPKDNNSSSESITLESGDVLMQRDEKRTAKSNFANKMTMFKASCQTKATSCKPFTHNEQTQTYFSTLNDIKNIKWAPFPIPIPFVTPLCIPIICPLPLPVPVPFIHPSLLSTTSETTATFKAKCEESKSSLHTVNQNKSMNQFLELSNPDVLSINFDQRNKEAVNETLELSPSHLASCLEDDCEQVPTDLEDTDLLNLILPSSFVEDDTFKSDQKDNESQVNHFKNGETINQKRDLNLALNQESSFSTPNKKVKH